MVLRVINTLPIPPNIVTYTYKQAPVKKDKCIVCFKYTHNKLKCCNQFVCTYCFYNWKQSSSTETCMHCGRSINHYLVDTISGSRIATKSEIKKFTQKSNI